MGKEIRYYNTAGSRDAEFCRLAAHDGIRTNLDAAHLDGIVSFLICGTRIKFNSVIGREHRRNGEQVFSISFGN